MDQMTTAPATSPMQRILDVVERVGNRVPHPVIIFVILIGVVIVLSHIFYMLGVRVSYQVINPETHEVEDATTAARSLLTVDGIRFMFTGEPRRVCRRLPLLRGWSHDEANAAPFT